MTNISSIFQRCQDAIDEASARLRCLNREIHSNPELGYEEFHAVQEISEFLKKEGFDVERNAYGLETSFATEIGRGGPLGIICAEYDALPVIGHACGHNLIATASVAAFLGTAAALKESGLAGRVRLLGTPAEEGGGGKIKMIDAGAFEEDIAAAIMSHPVGASQLKPGYSGLAGMELIASYKFKVEFHGRTAHAGGQPWKGINALDAAVATYNNISMLRQQIHPDERIHGVIEDGGTVPNVIPEYTRMNWYVRSPTSARCEELVKRVQNCCQAAAISTGCTFNYIWAPSYRNLRVNEPLCRQYMKDMRDLGETIMFRDPEAFTASTDMGNVSFEVPTFHGAFAIQTENGVGPHNPGFTERAGTDDAHEAAIKSAKGMAMLMVRILTDSRLAEEAKRAFDEPDSNMD